MNAMINTTYISPSTVANISCATCVPNGIYTQQETKQKERMLFFAGLRNQNRT